MSKYGLLFIVVLFNTTANLLLKKGALGINFPKTISLATIATLVAQVTTNAFLISGLTFFATGFFLWVLVLNKIQVSVAVPMMSMSYILITLFAYFFLNEPLTTLKILGIGLIIFGVVLISR